MKSKLVNNYYIYLQSTIVYVILFSLIEYSNNSELRFIETLNTTTTQATNLNSSLINSQNSISAYTYYVNLTNNIQSFIVPKNITFNLYVKGNPTTGYVVYLKNYASIDKDSLRFENIEYDTTSKYYLSNEYINDERNIISNPPIVGSGGYYKFKISALKDFREMSLQFIQMQPWDTRTEMALATVKLTTSSDAMTLQSNIPTVTSKSDGENISFNNNGYAIGAIMLLIGALL